jgi:hypothetical protein
LIDDDAVAHHVSFPSCQQNKNALLVVAQTIVAAALLESAVVNDFLITKVIALAWYMLYLFVRNAKKQGHSGVPLTTLAFIFALQSWFMFRSKQIIAVMLVSNISQFHVCKCKALIFVAYHATMCLFPHFATEQETTPGVHKCFEVAAAFVVFLDVAFGSHAIVLVPLAGFWFKSIHDELDQGLFNLHLWLVAGLYCIHAVVMTYAGLVAVSLTRGAILLNDESVNCESLVNPTNHCCSPCHLHLYFLNRKPGIMRAIPVALSWSLVIQTPRHHRQVCHCRLHKLHRQLLQFSLHC